VAREKSPRGFGARGKDGKVDHRRDALGASLHSAAGEKISEPCHLPDC
jgi:hypothetical protein